MNNILVGHTGAVSSVALSRDGRHALSASAQDGTVILWAVNTGQLLATIRMGDRISVVNHCCFCGVEEAEGNREGSVVFIAGACKDTVIRKWQVILKSDMEMNDDDFSPFVAEEMWAARGHTKEALCVSCRVDGRLLATSSVGPTIRLWDARTGKAMGKLIGHSNSVPSVAFAGVRERDSKSSE